MTALQFETAMTFLCKDTEKWDFELDLKSYESYESVPKVKGETLYSVYEDRGEFLIDTISYSTLITHKVSEFSAEELERIFEEIYYGFVNEEEFGSMEEYLRDCIGER